MKKYKCLIKQIYQKSEFSIIPIRFSDRYRILKWRNEQIYHLRQSKILKKEDQDLYFSNVINKTFEENNPSQILFSFLKNDKCVGYGGLVHINWIDSNAELSFLIDTKLQITSFEEFWTNYLDLIESVAFEDLNLHKIYTYAFDLRENLYRVLEKNKYNLECRYKEHIFYENKYIDVVVHSKINSN
jgi:RimJ/RimL family protein N-acetyltransferase